MFEVPPGAAAGDGAPLAALGAAARAVEELLQVQPPLRPILWCILRCELPSRSQDGADQWRLSRPVGEVLLAGFKVARLRDHIPVRG
jgi:hypothetical protein